MKKTVTAIVNGTPVYAFEGQTLAEIANIEKPCGGHGRCGKCKVIAKGGVSAMSAAEREKLTAEEIALGYRLGCLAYAVGDCEISFVSHTDKAQIVTEGVMPKIEIKPVFSSFGVAIDIGTTTVAARLYDRLGNMLADHAVLNAQASFGADVISRIEAALAGKDAALAASVRGVISQTVAALANAAGVDTKNIDALVITGNTVMLSLLAMESVEPFSHAPFAAKRLFGETVSAGSLSIDILLVDTPVYLSPCISAFVGADTVCALLATAMDEADTVMLADIGTNGEMALVRGGNITVCSTAAGPAFEGVGISMGMRGERGAIDRVSYSYGAPQVHVIGECEPIGICGSGLVDAVAYLLDSGTLEDSGYLDDEAVTIKAPVQITQKDIRMLQLAKSAICAGLLVLLEHEGANESDVSTLYVAGGFGRYLNRMSAEKIGLIPSTLARRCVAVGNAALAGASMLLLNTDAWKRAMDIASVARVVDLSSDPVFSDKYLMGMTLECV